MKRTKRERRTLRLTAARRTAATGSAAQSTSRCGQATVSLTHRTRSNDIGMLDRPS